MITNIDNRHKIGTDNCPYIISLLKMIKAGWIPPSEVSQKMYDNIKSNPNGYPDHLVGFVGYACSFGGEIFCGNG